MQPVRTAFADPLAGIVASSAGYASVFPVGTISALTSILVVLYYTWHIHVRAKKAG